MDPQSYIDQAYRKLAEARDCVGKALEDYASMNKAQKTVLSAVYDSLNNQLHKLYPWTLNM